MAVGGRASGRDEVETRYARRGDISIAYQVIGDGPVDVIVVSGLISHLDLLWAEPEAAAMLEELGSFCRLIVFDKPGTGLSDPVAGAPTPAQRADDVVAVLDAVGSGSAFVVGYSEGGFGSIWLAAHRPERVRGLILLETGPTLRPSDRYLPHLKERFEEVNWRDLHHARDHWGEGSLVLALSPTTRATPVYRRLAPTVERACASPGMARAMIDSLEGVDLVDLLPSIRVPTLVVQREGRWVPVEIGVDMAERIPGAQLKILPGDDHLIWFGDWRAFTDAVAEFVGVSPSAAAPRDRALLSIAFTDVVDSTATAARLGDERWRRLLDQHDELVRATTHRHGGVVVKGLGDGALLRFDHPAAALRATTAIVERAPELGIAVRAGVHCGECELVGDDLAGIAVHLGSRICSAAGPGEVWASSTVRELVFGSGFEFEDRGIVDLKGVPGSWRLQRLVGDRRSEQVAVTNDPAAAANTPAPIEAMTTFDRAMVRVASDAPGVARAALRVARRLRRAPA